MGHLLEIQRGQPRNDVRVEANWSDLYVNGTGTRRIGVHPIRRWFGISLGHKWFFGLMLFGPTRERHEVLPPLPGARKAGIEVREVDE